MRRDIVASLRELPELARRLLLQRRHPGVADGERGLVDRLGIAVAGRKGPDGFGHEADKVVERRAGANWRQLRLVSDEYQPRGRPPGDLGKQFGVDHARLIKDHGLSVEVRAAEAQRLALVAKHGMDRPRRMSRALAEPCGGLARERADFHIRRAEGVRDGANDRRVVRDREITQQEKPVILRECKSKIFPLAD